MTWRTGTKNPHTLYFYDSLADVSRPQGFILDPAVARSIVERLNAPEVATRAQTLGKLADANALLRWVRQLHECDESERSVRIRTVLDPYLEKQP